eukprot:Partr_v1_DN28905_c0_g1_i3_m25053 putative leucine-zipper-like transcription regulator 1
MLKHPIIVIFLTFVHMIKSQSTAMFIYENPASSGLVNCAAQLHRDSFVVVGGETDLMGTLNRNVLKFDTANSVWSKVEDIKYDVTTGPPYTPRIRMATYQYLGLIWIFGGTANHFMSNSSFNDVYTFDPVSDTFTYIPTSGQAMPPSWGHAVTMNNNKFYLFGFNTGNDTLSCTQQGSNIMYEYDPLMQHWRQVGSLNDGPPARFWPALASYKSSIYVTAGGPSLCDTDLLNDMWRFDIDTQIWTNLEPAGSELYLPGIQPLTATDSDSLYVYGAFRGKTEVEILSPNSVTKNLMKYEFESNQWKGVLTIDDAAPFRCGSFSMQGGQMGADFKYENL